MMPTGQERAATILREFEEARVDLLGKAVIFSGGKAGTIDKIFLDELHGLRIAVKGHKGKLADLDREATNSVALSK